MVTGVFMLVLVGLTSIGAYLVGVTWLRFPGRTLRPALDKMLECVGTTLIFVVLNLVLATTIILTMRKLTGRFVSVYVVNDITWLGLSLLQGVTFQWWREMASPPEAD